MRRFITFLAFFGALGLGIIGGLGIRDFINDLIGTHGNTGAYIGGVAGLIFALSSVTAVYVESRRSAGRPLWHRKPKKKKKEKSRKPNNVRQ